MAHYNHICGCYYILTPANRWSHPVRHYLPQVTLKAHTTILATTSKTVLTQTYVNLSKTKGINEIRYTFPLYDGNSVVGFTCRIGDRIINGEVKEKEKARAVYQQAVDSGQSAGLLEALPDASDVFTTTIGNVPPGATVLVDITYLGELKHDAEVDGVRFTIPTAIAPRYGSYPGEMAKFDSAIGKGFEVTVDAILGDGSFIREMRSPSHPIAVSLGTASIAPNADPTSNKASATLSLGTAELEKDFVLQVVAKETAIPKAMLETHPTIPGQRALMATLVPKFALPPERPEIVFVCDRSGSMEGSKITALKNALKVFLKSLPVGVKFNICSFGSRYSFLWPKSKAYSQSSLDEAMKHVGSFSANFGGTEMFEPVKETIKRRYKDMSLEMFLVTDGEIWDQQRLFTMLNEEIGEKKAPVRVFTLGIGDSFSSALIEGVARAGNGFSQAVGEHEKLDGKVVRMLKGALSPHINDYTIEIKYGGAAEDDDDFEIIEKVTDYLKVVDLTDDKESDNSEKIKKPISLFDTSANLDAEEPVKKDDDGQGRYSHLPVVEPPKILQAPHEIPPLFAFSRTSVYLILSPMTTQRVPKSVVLRATSTHGPLELEIPVQVLDQPGETIHQLAAKKAIAELEEGRGWLASAKDPKGKSIKGKYPGRFDEMVEREAVRLGVQFQVGGKWCSFVAVEKKSEDAQGDERMSDKENDWENLDDEMDGKTLGGEPPSLERGERLDRYVQPQYRQRDQHGPSSVYSSRSSYRGGSRGGPRGRGYHAIRPNTVEFTREILNPFDQPVVMQEPANTEPPSLSATTESYNSSSQSFRRSARKSSSVLSSISPVFGSMRSYAAPPPPAAPSMAPTGFGPQSCASPQMFQQQQQQQQAMPGYMGPQVALSAGSAPGGGHSRASRSAPVRKRGFGGSVPEKKTKKKGAFGLSSFKGAQTESMKESDTVPQQFAMVEKEMDMSMDMSIIPDEEMEEELESASYLFPSAMSAPAAQPKSTWSRARSSSSSSKSAVSADPLLVLAELQTFEGFWEWSSKLCSALGIQKSDVEAKSKGTDKKILATALAVRFLEVKLKSERESWELFVEKAKGWLEMQGCDDGAEVWGIVGAVIR